MLANIETLASNGQELLSAGLGPIVAPGPAALHEPEIWRMRASREERTGLMPNVPHSKASEEASKSNGSRHGVWLRGAQVHPDACFISCEGTRHLYRTSRFRKESS